MVSPSEAPRPKLVLPELPTPYPGVYGEITKELSSNPTLFLTNAERRIKSENPDLGIFLRRILIDSPDPSLDAALREHSKRWTLTYYEIFSRSARQSGIPMLTVTENTIRVYSRLKFFDLLAKDAINQSMEYLNAEWNLQTIKITEDEQKNEELENFWTNVKGEMALLGENGYDDFQLHNAIYATLVLRDFFQTQDHEYRLYERYLPK